MVNWFLFVAPPRLVQDAERVITEEPAVPHVRFYDPQLLEDLEGAAGAFLAYERREKRAMFDV